MIFVSLLRQCAECMNQPFLLKVKITHEGKMVEPAVCSRFISPTFFEEILLILGSNV